MATGPEAHVAVQDQHSANEVPLGPLIWQRATAWLSFVKDNLVLVGISLYAYVTVVGLLYSAGLYWRLGINPLHFFQVSDFLLAGLRHPAALVMPLLILVLDALMLAIIFLPTLWLIKRAATIKTQGGRQLTILPDQLRGRLENTLWLSLYSSLFWGVLAAAFGLIVIPVVGMGMIDNCGQPVRIWFKKDAVGEKEPADAAQRTIVGAIQSMILVRDEHGSYSAIPLDVVRQIEFETPSPGSISDPLGCALVE